LERDFLKNNAALAGRQHRLAVDVASLEWAYVDEYDGRQLAPLTSDDLGALGAASKLSLQRHLRLLELAYPDELVLTVRRQSPESEIVSSAASEHTSRTKIRLPPIQRSKTDLAVHRFDNSVYSRPIERETYLLLTALRDGDSIAGALEVVLQYLR
jgi:hypothetical protein